MEEEERINREREYITIFLCALTAESLFSLKQGPQLESQLASFHVHKPQHQSASILQTQMN